MAMQRPAKPAPMTRAGTGRGSASGPMAANLPESIELSSIALLNDVHYALRHDQPRRPGPDDPGRPSRAAARAGGAAALDEVSRRAVDRDARRGGRHLPRAALPLLRQQARLP